LPRSYKCWLNDPCRKSMCSCEDGWQD
jgi:hypothetical protein